MEKEIYYSDIYGQRVLVFLENAPQSNKYHQILLTPEKYKRLTDLLSDPIDGDVGLKDVPELLERRQIKTGEEEYELADLSVAYKEGSF